MEPRLPKLSLALRLAHFALAYMRALVLLIASVILFSAARASVAWIIGGVVDSGLLTNTNVQNPSGTTAFVGLAVIVMAGVLFVSEYAYEYYAGYISYRVLIDLRCQLCQKLLSMSISFFNDRRNGDLISRLTNDTQITDRATRLLFGDVIKQTWVLLFCVGAMFYFCWQLTLIVLIVTPVIGLLIQRFGKRVLRASLKSLGSFSDLTQEMSQIFSGIRTVKVFHMEEREMEEFRAISDRLFSAQMQMTRANAASRASTTGLSTVGLGLALCVGFLLLQRTSLEPRNLYACLALAATIYRPLKNLGRAYNSVNEGLGATHRIFEHLDAQPEVEESPDATQLPDEHTGVHFRNVSFAYNGEYVLRDVNLDVTAGQVIAFVGPSGAGKSTLLDLIPRFYDPQEGAVEVDGLDVRQARRVSLLRKIAVVTQQTFLFNASILENIRYAHPEATEEEVFEAARLARIHEHIHSLPNGYDTVIGEQGIKLSGGQRQRISLARAFVKKAQILILDEATSELDTQTEKEIQESLHQISRGRTTFVVAHRLSTVVNADRIVVMESGRVLEEGSHEELLGKNGLYRRLYKMQFAGLETERGTAENGSDPVAAGTN